MKIELTRIVCQLSSLTIAPNETPMHKDLFEITIFLDVN